MNDDEIKNDDELADPIDPDAILPDDVLPDDEVAVPGVESFEKLRDEELLEDVEEWEDDEDEEEELPLDDEE